MITSPRICAALAVYELAAGDDWALRATVANTTLNAFRDADRVPDCAAGVTAALTQNFEPARWQLSLDAADAVLSGSYEISPAACVRANAVVPCRPQTARAEHLPGAGPGAVRHARAGLRGGGAVITGLRTEPRAAMVGAQRLPLSPTESKVLQLIINAGDTPISRSALEEPVWRCRP